MVSGPEPDQSRRYGTVAAPARCSRGSFSPLAPKQPLLHPKPKRILHIFASGAHSISIRGSKPELDKLNEKNLPGDARRGFRSPFKFKKTGKSGIEVSEVFPLIGQHIDDIAVIRSMYTDIPDHGRRRS